jgi:hypothetical protein
MCQPVNRHKVKRCPHPAASGLCDVEVVNRVCLVGRRLECCVVDCRWYPEDWVDPDDDEDEPGTAA